MAFEINRYSAVQSFVLDTLKGESLEVYLYGCKYNGSTYLASPDAALLEVNTALDTILYLEYRGVLITTIINNLGTSLVFALDDARYRESKYLNPEYITTLRTSVQNALNNNAPNLVYEDVVIGTAQVNRDYI